MCKFACKSFDVACKLCEHFHDCGVFRRRGTVTARCSASCVNRAFRFYSHQNKLPVWGPVRPCRSSLPRIPRSPRPTDRQVVGWSRSWSQEKRMMHRGVGLGLHWWQEAQQNPQCTGNFLPTVPVNGVQYSPRWGFPGSTSWLPSNNGESGLKVQFQALGKLFSDCQRSLHLPLRFSGFCLHDTANIICSTLWRWGTHRFPKSYSSCVDLVSQTSLDSENDMEMLTRQTWSLTLMQVRSKYHTPGPWMFHFPARLGRSCSEIEIGCCGTFWWKWTKMHFPLFHESGVGNADVFVLIMAVMLGKEQIKTGLMWIKTEDGTQNITECVESTRKWKTAVPTCFWSSFVQQTV